MATIPPPPASLATMPEELLVAIVTPLLGLKWYSLQTLVALSHTNSYLRAWLTQDDTLWHRALLGRAMGRPLHTIPGFAGSVEHEAALQAALEQVRQGGSAKQAVQALSPAALMGISTVDPTKSAPLAAAPSPAAPGSPAEGSPAEEGGDGSGALSKSKKKKLKEKAKKEAAAAGSTAEGGADKDDEAGDDSGMAVDTTAPDLQIDPDQAAAQVQPYNLNGPNSHSALVPNPPLPLRTLPPLTFRDLAMRIHAHEAKCVNCKVADSKLSHYYMSNDELRPAEKMGVNKNVIDRMGNGWGEGPFAPAKLDRVLTPFEASTKAVRTAKFFVGYDFFGFCQYTLAIRIKTKSEPLTQPALARIEVSVFVPAKAVITITNHGVQMPPQEVVKVGAFIVENWGGVTLGDFQVAFERWVNEPMSPDEIKLYETKCNVNRAKGKLHTRVAFIPPAYSARFRMDEGQRLYEIGDIRPLGNRIEHGRAAILLGDRYPPQ